MIPIELVYLQQDYRVTDHRPFLAASKSGLPVIAIYNHLPQWNQVHPQGFPQMSERRRSFVNQSLHSLKEELDQKNIPLLLFERSITNAIDNILEQYSIVRVHAHDPQGTWQEDQVKKAQEHLGDIPWTFHEGRTLHNPSTLPFSIEELPLQFTRTRQKIEASCKIEPPLPAPPKQERIALTVLDDSNNFSVPKVDTFVPAGINAAKARLHHYTFESNAIASYKNTRNGMTNKDDSSKLSIYLSTGSISPKEVMYEVQKYEAKRTKNQSTYWLYFELLWRDFFHFTLLKYKQHIFHKWGIKKQGYKIEHNPQLIQKWIDGTTGYPLIDANMKELKATGYMSNRGRQNVASFFVHYLKQDWRIGADYFASMLLDFDVASNYLNWQYQAGVGNDSRQNRIFHVEKQGERYDKDRSYLLKWLPQFHKVPKEFQYKPYKMNRTIQERQNFILGRDYPKPICKKPF